MLRRTPPGLDLTAAADTVRAYRRLTPERRALLVGLSGIDASGKGHLARELAQRLKAMGLAPVVINVDGWLNLPGHRFGGPDPATHFYRHALRLDEMFGELVLPLRRDRRADVVVRHAEETATVFRRQRHRYCDVDVVLLEGIFLYKRAYRRHFDLALWVDCGFETALERAIARAQEGLSPAATVTAYETLYFPAQRLHFRLDRPRAGADFLLPNDPRLEAATGAVA